MQINHFGKTFDVTLRTSLYGNGNLAVVLDCENVDEDGGGYTEVFATLSVNVEGVLLPANQFVAKTYSENAGLNEQLIKAGLFKDTGRRAMAGYAGPQPILEMVY